MYLLWSWKHCTSLHIYVFRLDKANLKCKEAEHIRKTYCQIKSKLEDEHKTFETQLDEMEQEIKRFVKCSENSVFVA